MPNVFEAAKERAMRRRRTNGSSCCGGTSWRGVVTTERRCSVLWIDEISQLDVFPIVSGILCVRAVLGVSNRLCLNGRWTATEEMTEEMA